MTFMNRSSDLVIVIWSFRKGDGVLSVTLDRWITYAKSIGLTLYVATDSIDLKYRDIIIFSKSNWKKEWSDVLDVLKQKGVTNFISILDDFYWLNGPDKCQVEHLNDLMQDHEIAYLALEPHPAKSNLLDNIISKSSTGFKELGLEDMYPSSLRPSIWSLLLFEKTLSAVSNIWEFETVYINTYKYVTIVDCDFKMSVVHLLEKGKVNYNLAYLDSNGREKLMKSYQYDYNQLSKIPRIILSNLCLKLIGFRIHNVFSKCRNTRI